MATVLQYVPFSSMVEPGFWHKLSENKLNVYGLDDKPQQIKGFYFNGDPGGLAPRVTLDFAAFDVSEKVPPRNLLCSGVLHNVNTEEAFKDYDKKQLIQSLAQEIWNDIKTGAALKQPSLLSKFLLLTYANLKKYHYFYWFAFPCLAALETVTLNSPSTTIDKRFSSAQVTNFLRSYDAFQQSKGQFENYFILVEEGEQIHVQDVSTLAQVLEEKKKVMAGFCDPSTLETNPGWPLRNFITLLAFHFGSKLQDLEIVCLRDRSWQGKRDISHSLLLAVKLTDISAVTELPKVLGWEKNERQKLGARMINLSSSMDPKRLAESAVDLNLKLMRWRLMPDLNLDKIGATKCLLLGAGTLGCNVARNLLSWGVHHITFLDNARVSYSNPVRQSLFTFEDCMDGGKPKAQAAADALKRIFPGVTTEGIAMSIPMPGHAVSSGLEKQVEEDVSKLESLVDQHDAVFLLMDTRESRWLPSVMAAAKGKIVINAALGFDTFLVLRHGVKSGDSTPAGEGEKMHFTSDGIPGSQLGCYFCNDVVAPGNVYRDCATGEEIQCHTNTIEGAWARAKRHFVKMNGTSAAQFESHLCEVMWRAWNTDGCRILNFLAFMRNIYTLRAPPAYTYPIPIFPSWAQNEDVTMPGDFDVTQVNIVPQYGSTFMRSVKDFSLVIPPGEDTFTGEEEGGGQIADTDTSVFRSDSLALKVQEELPSIPVLRRSMSWEIPEIRRLNTADPPFPLLHDTTSPQDITSSMPILTAQSVPCILDTTAFSQPPTLTPIASDEMATCSHGSSRRAVSTVTRPLTSTPFMRTANESSQRKKKPEKRPMTKVLTSNDEAMAGVSNSKPQNRTKKGRPVTKIDTHTKLRRVSSFEADFAPVKKFRKPPVAGRKR